MATDKILITPLRKRRPNGEPYTRVPEIETLLVELSSLSRDELLERAQISRRDAPGYVPSECLLYFIRASRADNNEDWFERLYRILNERVLRSLPKAENLDEETASYTRGAIRDAVHERFVERLAADRSTYSERLDYFEVRFDGALASLRRDAQEKFWREESRSRPLDDDDETGELSPEVERAAVANFDPFALFNVEDLDFRMRLDAAIDDLPPVQRRILGMLDKGFPIDSKGDDVITIAKTLGRSEKTIRNQRDKAYATLRAKLIGGDEQ